ncbi:MAG: hypothetical protein GYA47_01790 [Desulfovibrio sp.]|nr:hypothetical protein [Desulfovibrio sp.]
MTRPACFLISLVLHGGLVFWLAAGPGLIASFPDATAPEPDAVRVEMVPPEKLLEDMLPLPEADRAVPEPEAGTGREAQSRPPHAGREDVSSTEGDLGASAPGVEVISPVKRNMNLPPPIHLGQGQIKTGKVTAMTLRRLAGYDFTLDEFCGHYEINGEPGHFLSILDGRAAFGGLVMRDSATGTVRLLTRFSKFIFTYGPGFSQAEPAEGSITFMARKEFERIPDVDERSRLLWQAEAPPARIGVRLDFQERTVSLKSPADAKKEIARGGAVVRSDGGPYPWAVVSFGDDCPAWGEFPWLARAAAAKGLGVLGLAPPGCLGRRDGKRPETPAGSTSKESLAAGLASLSGASGKDAPGGGTRIGLWGFGSGTAEVLRAAEDGRAVFVVLAPDAVGEGTPKAPDTAGLERIQAPVLLVFFSQEAARDWEGAASGLRGQGTEVDVVVLPSSGAAASGERSVEDVAGRMFAVLGAALPWSLDKAR